MIVYVTFPRRSEGVYWWAVHTSRGWVSRRLIAAGGSSSPTTIEHEYSGGIALDHSDPSVLYIFRQAAVGWEIERWATTDSGRSWRHQVVVPADGTENVRPVVPLGSHGGPMSLVWLRGTYGSYTAYRTAIA